MRFVRFVGSRGRLVAVLASCLSFASIGAAEVPTAFDSIKLSSAVPGARADQPGEVRTSISVGASGDVRVELAAGARVLATATGKATAEELSRIARALEPAGACSSGAPAAGASSFVLSWTANGKKRETRGAVPARETTESPLGRLVDALRRVQARCVWSDWGAAPLSAKAVLVEGVVEVKGDDVVVRDAKLGPVVVKDTPKSSALAWNLRSEKGRSVRLTGTVKRTAGGAVLQIEAAESSLAKKAELFLFARADGWPYSVKLAAGTPVRVRAAVADADGNTYDEIEVAGGLQGSVLSKLVKLSPGPTAGIAGSVPGR